MQYFFARAVNVVNMLGSHVESIIALLNQKVNYFLLEKFLTDGFAKVYIFSSIF